MIDFAGLSQRAFGDIDASPHKGFIDESPSGGFLVQSELLGDSSIHETLLDPETLDEQSKISQDEYLQLQLRIYRLAFVLAAIFVVLAAFLFGQNTSISILVGALSGILYLRLLARGIGKLGSSQKIVGKIQLIIPVILVLVVSKLPELQLLPALLGFLLYKPSLVIQFLLEPKVQ